LGHAPAKNVLACHAPDGCHTFDNIATGLSRVTATTFVTDDMALQHFVTHMRTAQQVRGCK